jgi:hypothetical protein
MVLIDNFNYYILNMRTIIILSILLSVTAFSFPGAEVPQDGCPDKTELQTVKNEHVDFSEGFPHVYAYGNYNKMFNSYRAIFLNYERSNDRDFKKMEGDEIKVAIMVFNMKGTELTEGVYTLDGGDSGNQFSVGIETSEGSSYSTFLNGADIGSVTINRLDDEWICGEVNVTDSNGMKVRGTFSVPNEKMR